MTLLLRYVPISFGVSVISAESALPFTLRAEGTRPFALSLAAFTAFGVAASVLDALLVALLELDNSFLCCRSVLSGIFPVSKVIGCLYRFRCCGQCFRRAVGGTTELDNPFLCCRGGTRAVYFALARSYAAFTAIGVAAWRFRSAVGGATELDKSFSRCSGILCSIFTVSKIIRCLNRFRRCSLLSDMLLVALLS